jgi:hypothetical protein
MKNRDLNAAGLSVHIKSVNNGFICSRVGALVGDTEHVFTTFTEAVDWMAGALDMRSNLNERVVRLVTIGEEKDE